MLRILLGLLLSINLCYASGTVKLVDYLVNGAGVVEILGKHGIKGQDAQQVKSYVNSALAALNSQGKSLSKEELRNVLAALPVTGQDANVRKELQLLLEKSEAEIKKEDVVKAVNNIIYLANRHGKSVIVTCSDCVNESLAKNGFKFTVEAVKNAKSQELLKNVIPNNPKELNSFISARMRRLGLGDYSKVSPAEVAPTEEKSLALFLALAESGSKEQKDMIAAIKRVSTTNGKVNIIDPKNQHKFWREMSDDMSPETMQSWTKTLNEVAAIREKEGLSAEEAFYRSLKDKADKNPELQSTYKALREKRCFFK